MAQAARDDLVRRTAHDALALEVDGPAAGRIRPEIVFSSVGLAGAVGADQGDDLPCSIVSATSCSTSILP
jgi:hypothetical protein